jgi:lipoate-protein ligase A
MSAKWRLILDDVVMDGAWNMALDRAIQLTHSIGESPPTLRLYRWKRPTVTLGRFQAADGIDRDLCASLGIDVVRRYTGGRGVLHDDELTYSVCVGTAEGIPRGTVASYRMLCAALVEAYRLLGVDAGLTRRERGDSSSPACYLLTSLADVSLGAMKLSGSAQVWSGDTVLQHGSFVRARDLGTEEKVFMLTQSEVAKLAGSTSTLADALGSAPTYEAIADAACAAFESVLGVELVMGISTESEEATARGLLDEVRC